VAIEAHWCAFDSSRESFSRRLLVVAFPSRRCVVFSSSKDFFVIYLPPFHSHSSVTPCSSGHLFSEQKHPRQLQTGRVWGAWEIHLARAWRWHMTEMGRELDPCYLARPCQRWILKLELLQVVSFSCWLLFPSSSMLRNEDRFQVSKHTRLSTLVPIPLTTVGRAFLIHWQLSCQFTYYCRAWLSCRNLPFPSSFTSPSLIPFQI
jgi:hypothetical protein